VLIAALGIDAGGKRHGRGESQKFTKVGYHRRMLEKALCPKCKNVLLYVTSLPHPTSPQMRKTTFVCYSCKRTLTYQLTAELAELYATQTQIAAIA
jgi:transposase-like protein